MAAVRTVQAVLRAFFAERGCRAPQQVLVAVSGGTDSLALWHALTALAAEGGPSALAVHVDHGLRGAASAADAASVAATAAAWQQPLCGIALQLPAGTTPAAAREARYRAFAELAAARQPVALLTAHQADDQAETVLHHLIRGGGPAGLRGMLPETPAAVWAPNIPAAAAVPLWRPFLSIERSLLTAYCAAVGLEPRQDLTNDDRHYLRPRLRHDLLPQLRTENPQIVAAIGRTARLLADDLDVIDQLLRQRLPALILAADGDSVLIDRDAFLREHPALQRAAIRRLCGGFGALELSFAAVDQLLAVVGGRSGVRLSTVGGIVCTVDQRSWRLSRGNPSAGDAPQLTAAAAVAAAVLQHGWQVLLQEQAPGRPDLWWYAVESAQLPALQWRNRRPGDRLRPYGAPGRRRVQDILVDRRVPRALRDRWPLLVQDDLPIWIPGVASIQPPAAAATGATIWIGIVKTPLPEQE